MPLYCNIRLLDFVHFKLQLHWTQTSTYTASCALRFSNSMHDPPCRYGDSCNHLLFQVSKQNGLQMHKNMSAGHFILVNESHGSNHITQKVQIFGPFVRNRQSLSWSKILHCLRNLKFYCHTHTSAHSRIVHWAHTLTSDPFVWALFIYSYHEHLSICTQRSQIISLSQISLI
jgi:hypothetical protein